MADIDKMQRDYAAWQEITAFDANNITLKATLKEKTTLEINIDTPVALSDDGKTALLMGIRDLVKNSTPQNAIKAAALSILVSETGQEATIVRDNSASTEDEAQNIITDIGYTP